MFSPVRTSLPFLNLNYRGSVAFELDDKLLDEFSQEFELGSVNNGNYGYWLCFGSFKTATSEEKHEPVLKGEIDIHYFMLSKLNLSNF